MSAAEDHDQHQAETVLALGSLRQYDSNGLTEMVQKLTGGRKEFTAEEFQMMIQSRQAMPDTVNLQQLATVATSATVPSDEPNLEIVEQPKSKGIRFRYKCEGRSAGSIPGENSTTEHKTFPSVKINNFRDQAAIVVVSCVTKEEPYRPHPHTLVGKECRKGVCTIKLKRSNVATFPNLGIQCVTKKEIKESLQEREQIRVDPFGTGYFNDVSKLQLNIVRLCFQAFLPDEEGKYTRIVPPVVSQPIYDKKAVNDLVVCRLSKQSGNAKGGDEVFMLCEKVNKDDIQVRFYEEIDDDLAWESYAEFSPQADVHRQFAIVFKTPAYKDQYINHPVIVNMQLFRPSDEGTSEPKQFQYIPNDPDPDQIARKRKRKANLNFLSDTNPNTPAFNLLTDNLKDDPDSPRSSQILREKLKEKMARTQAMKLEPDPVMTHQQQQQQQHQIYVHNMDDGTVTYHQPQITEEEIQTQQVMEGEVVIETSEIPVSHAEEEVHFTAATALTQLGGQTTVQSGQRVNVIVPQDEDDDVMLQDLPISRALVDNVDQPIGDGRIDSGSLPSLGTLASVTMDEEFLKQMAVSEGKIQTGSAHRGGKILPIPAKMVTRGTRKSRTE